MYPQFELMSKCSLSNQHQPIQGYKFLMLLVSAWKHKNDVKHIHWNSWVLMECKNNHG